MKLQDEHEEKVKRNQNETTISAEDPLKFIFRFLAKAMRAPWAQIAVAENHGKALMEWQDEHEEKA